MREGRGDKRPCTFIKGFTLIADVLTGFLLSGQIIWEAEGFYVMKALNQMVGQNCAVMVVVSGSLYRVMDGET